MSDTIALPESGLILPPGVVPEVKAVAVEDVEYQNADTKAKQVPEPQGWKILCALIDVSDTYDSGLHKSDGTKKAEEITSPVLFVMKKGPLCYLDKEKFTDGRHWCEEGDFVVTRPYTGTRMIIHGKEFRVINDDQVEAVVQDPRGISRA
jgi:co-chaperonin GroES (HSP10)